MLESLRLANFRKFKNYSIRLRAGNVLVGPNNAGKSSILDAFRLFDACFRFLSNKNPRMFSFAGRGVVVGHDIPDSVFPFDMANATFNCGDEPAELELKHSCGITAVIVYDPLNGSKLFLDGVRGRVATASKFRSSFPVDFVLIPTLSPLEPNENYVTDETVRRNAGNRLASRVLRNIWLRRPEAEFREFADSIAQSWIGIELRKPEVQRGENNSFVRMYYAENRIEREVNWAGFGFQAWLQIQTHLRRATENSVLIIDEPDVYLHPDIQRRLLIDIKQKFPQFVMATHAVEIINEADADEIVTINNRFQSAKRLRTEADYQAVYKYIGSGENAAFARLAKAKKVIFVEGNDGRIFRKFASRFKLDALADAQHVPIIKLGGFTEWRRASAAAWALKDILGIDIKIMCIFDRDYRGVDEVDSFLSERGDEGIDCKVLSQKEVENFLLVVGPLRRAVEARCRSRQQDILEVESYEIRHMLDIIVSDLRHAAQGQMISHAIRYAKKIKSSVDEGTIATGIGRAMAPVWENEALRCAYLPGKEAFSMLNDLIRKKYSVSISESLVIDNISVGDIDPEFLDVLHAMNEFCQSD